MADTLLWPSTEQLSWLANLITVVGLPIAITGLFAVRRQMKNDRLAASAGVLGELRASMMQRVDRLHHAGKTQDVALWTDEAQEFMNDIEMACAIYLDGQMSGRTGRLAKNMICDFLEIINKDEDLREEMAKAIHAPDTFANIRDFRTGINRHD